MNMNIFVQLVAALVLSTTLSGFAADRKIVLLAGSASHGIGEHEYRAGCLLLQKCLQSVAGINAVVYTNNWPTDPKAFDGADRFFPINYKEHWAVVREVSEAGGEKFNRAAYEKETKREEEAKKK